MKFLSLLFLLTIATHAISQEQLGLRLENYAGVSGIANNPAANLSNPLPWDINLVGAGFYFDNNYFFIKNTNALDLLKNGPSSSFYLATEVPQPAPSNTYVVDFNNDGHKRFFSINTYVAGPSFVARFGENHSAGLFTNFRVVGNTLDVPNEFSFYKYDSRSFFDPFTVKPFEGAFMSWSEIGLNYAYKIPTYGGFMGLGISLKRLTGYEAGYIQNLRTWEHTKLPDDAINISNAFGRYGLTTSNLSNSGQSISPNGKGFSFDIGFVKVVEERENGYRYKLSFALTDIGFINFKKNAQAYVVENPGTFQLSSKEFEKFDNIEQYNDVLELFSQQALGDSLASFAGSQFQLALPAAISLQADFGLTDHVYINGAFFNQLPTKVLAPRRESVLAVTPRFEHRWFSASVPVSLLNWQELRLGLAARLGFLTIGSDKIGSLIGRSDYSGSDVYVAIKINYFDLGLNLFRNMGGGKRGYGNSKNAKCYNF